jgi:hypothetical protein
MTNDTPKKSKAGLLDNKQDIKQEETCPWHINSSDHFNCLWIYIIDKSGPDGSMPELVQSEIAQLLGWSNTKTHFMLKQAMAELIEALTTNNASQLIGKDADQIVDIRSFDIDPISSYSSDDTED